MLSSDTPCLCHLMIKNLYIREERSFNIDIFVLSRFKKVKFNIYIYFYIILARKLFNFVICSVEMESLLITSSNISSTLNLVEFIISARLST